MDSPEITIRLRKEHRQLGQVVSITASTPSGQILGVVELQIPLLPKFSLSERIGADAEQGLIQVASDLARQIAVGVLTEPSGAAT